MPLRAGQGEGGGSLNLVHNASDVDDDNDERRKVDDGKACPDPAESGRKGVAEVRQVYCLDLDVSGLDGGERGLVLFREHLERLRCGCRESEESLSTLRVHRAIDVT